MNKNRIFAVISIFLIMVIVPLQVFGQSQHLEQTLKWQADKNAMEYKVEVQNIDTGAKSSYKTSENFITVKLFAGHYKYRVFVYDFLSRESSVSEWRSFDVIKALAPKVTKSENAKNDVTTVKSGSKVKVPLEVTNIDKEAKVELINTETRKSIEGTLQTKNSDGQLVVASASFPQVEEGTWKVRVTNPGGLYAESQVVKVTDQVKSDKSEKEVETAVAKSSREEKKAKDVAKNAEKAEKLAQAEKEAAEKQAAKEAEKAAQAEKKAAKEVARESEKIARAEESAAAKAAEEKARAEEKAAKETEKQAAEEAKEAERLAKEAEQKAKEEAERKAAEEKRILEAQKKAEEAQRRQEEIAKRQAEAKERARIREEQVKIAAQQKAERKAQQELLAQQRAQAAAEREAKAKEAEEKYQEALQKEKEEREAHEALERKTEEEQKAQLQEKKQLAKEEKKREKEEKAREKEAQKIAKAEEKTRKKEEKAAAREERKIAWQNRRMIDLNIQAGGGAMFNLYDGKLFAYSDNEILPMVKLDISLLPIKIGGVNLGFEVNALASYFKTDNEFYNMLMPLGIFNFDLAMKFPLVKEKVYVAAKGGGGISLIDMQIQYGGAVNRTQDSTALYGYLCANGELSLVFLPSKGFTIEAGADFTHIFIKDMPTGCISPFLNIGVRF